MRVEPHQRQPVPECGERRPDRGEIDRAVAPDDHREVTLRDLGQCRTHRLQMPLQHIGVLDATPRLAGPIIE